MNADKADLLAIVLNTFQKRGTPSFLPPVNESIRGDFGDQGEIVRELFLAQHLSSATAGKDGEINALRGVDLSPADRVRLGALVTIRQAEGEDLTLFVLPVHCASPVLPGIQVVTPKSPVGAALNGKKPGEIVQVETPRGAQTIRIVSVE